MSSGWLLCQEESSTLSEKGQEEASMERTITEYLKQKEKGTLYTAFLDI